MTKPNLVRGEVTGGHANEAGSSWRAALHAPRWGACRCGNVLWVLGAAYSTCSTSHAAPA
jgi:hypothetical protein